MFGQQENDYKQAILINERSAEMNDLTKGKPLKLIFWFTIPLLIGNIFQQFYSLSDTLIVGQTLGSKP
ncbi:Na+ driven multidrug efflux protein, MATE family [Lactiplantibacillus plantarum]|nr:Na+ driven multidrug efflux protein, MATE family [Lactiplantibacillus plantarum]